jgi:hypothetical protein
MGRGFGRGGGVRTADEAPGDAMLGGNADKVTNRTLDTVLAASDFART